MTYQVQVDSDTGLEVGSKGSKVRDLQKKKKGGWGMGGRFKVMKLGFGPSLAS